MNGNLSGFKVTAMEKSRREEIWELFDQGYAPREVEDMGYSHAQVYEEKPKWEKANPQSNKPQGATRALTPGKSIPVECIIDNIAVPDGHRESFEQGMKFGMQCLLIGVRVAQELSATGVQQAKPLIDMAKDMRAGEVQAADTAARKAAHEAAFEAVERVAAQLPKAQDKKPDVTQAQRPMEAMLARQLETVLDRMTGMMLGGPPDGATLPPDWSDRRGNPPSREDDLPSAWGDRRG